LNWATLGVLPAITTGRISDVYSYTKTNPDGSKSNELDISYTFNVAGTDYTGWHNPLWGTFKIGDKVNIRYDPKKPSDSEIWRPGKPLEWTVVTIIWLTWVLGTSFFVTLIGVSFMIGAGWSIKHAKGFIKQGVLGIIVLVALAIFLLIFGFLSIEMAIDILRHCGFAGQVWLWTVWNHQPACFLP
jgi:hypothetical protein